MLILSVSRYHCGLLVSHNDGRWDSGVYTNTDFVVHTNKSSQHGQKVCVIVLNQNLKLLLKHKFIIFWQFVKLTVMKGQILCHNRVLLVK